MVRRSWLPALHVAILPAAGVLLLLLMTPWGIGTSPDSVHYIRAAREFLSPAAAAGDVLLVQHAPLYSLLLATGRGAGVDPLDAARWLNALLFGLNILLVASLVHRVSGSMAGPPLIGALLMFAAPVLVVHATALSEPVFLFLTLLGFLLLAIHLEARSAGASAPALARRLKPARYGAGRGTLFAGAGALGLAFLARYAGLAGVFTGVAALLLFRTDRLTRRLRDATLFGVVACAPMVAWMLRNIGEATTATGREIVFHPIDRSDVWQALYTVSGWALVPASAPDAIRLALGLLLGAGLLALLYRSTVGASGSDAPPVPALVRVLALFIAIYAAFLVVSISLIDANTPLDNRILLPAFVSGAILLLYGLGRAWPAVNPQRLLAVTLAALVIAFTAGHLWRSTDIVAASYASGWGFSSRDWRESATLARVRAVPLETTIHSNAPEIVYLHTGRRAKPLPRKWLPMTQRENPGIDGELSALRSEIASTGGLVVYFRRAAQTRAIPTETELIHHLSLHVLAEEADGALLAAEASPAARLSCPWPPC